MGYIPDPSWVTLREVERRQKTVKASQYQYCEAFLFNFCLL